MPSPSDVRFNPQKSKPIVKPLGVGIVFVLGACAYAAYYSFTHMDSTRVASTLSGDGYQASVSAAMSYVQALQTGQVQQALLRVAWVEDRLARVRAERGTTEAENEALAGLAKGATATDRTQAVVRPEGIEDQYIFVPRATVEAAGADAGRAGLERPTSGRAWLRVSYPDPTIAPADDAGRAIKSLTVGINLSDDQKVLKASIIGNLDIDRFSIRYF